MAGQKGKWHEVNTAYYETKPINWDGNVYPSTQEEHDSWFAANTLRGRQGRLVYRRKQAQAIYQANGLNRYQARRAVYGPTGPRGTHSMGPRKHPVGN